MMNLIDSICKFIENTEDKSDNELKGKIRKQPGEAQEENFSSELNPREGMSMESAKFAIGRCKGNSQFEIHDLENKVGFAVGNFHLLLFKKKSGYKIW
jgi:hypothetical protein